MTAIGFLRSFPRFSWHFSFFETVWLGAILPDLSAGSQKGSTCHEALQGPFMQKWETCSDQVYATQPKLLGTS